MNGMAERFYAKVQVTDGCWPWTAQRDSHGYGLLPMPRGLPMPWLTSSRTVKAHRLAWYFVYGPIPDGLDVDHVCHNGSGCPGGKACQHRRCVNPAHLALVRRGENVLRGEGLTARRKRQTHCKRGHEFTPENTVTRPSAPSKRECRTCGSDMHKVWLAEHKDGGAPA